MNWTHWLPTYIPPLILGGTITLVVVKMAQLFTRLVRRNTGAKRIASVANLEEAQPLAAFSSASHKIQLLFLQFGISPREHPERLLWILRAVISLPIFIGLNLFLFAHWLPNLAFAFLIAYFLTQTILSMTWMNTMEKLEDDLLTFNASIRNTFKVIPDVASAVAFECELFDPDRPLRQWMEQQFLQAAKSAAGLQSSFPMLKEEAYRVSRSLYNCVALLENVNETGESQLDQAYLQTEEDLNIRARVRDQIQQVVSGTRSQKLILVFITLALMFALGRSDLVRASALLIRAVYILLLGMMAVGWSVITDMVERTLR